MVAPSNRSPQDPASRPPAAASRPTDVERHPEEPGPPGGTPYTVHFPAGAPLDAADLAHPAPLPHVGDVVEYIDEELASHRFVVREVVHTLQPAHPEEAHARPRGAPTEGRGDQPGPEQRPPAELRSGLPKVFLEAETAAGAGTQRRSRRPAT
jgi:hypothetical protein